MAPAAVQAIGADFGHRPEAVTRLADIIPSKEALTTREYWDRHNQLGFLPASIPGESRGSSTA